MIKIEFNFIVNQPIEKVFRIQSQRVPLRERLMWDDYKPYHEFR
jgi:hypothetical protein